MYCLTSSLYSIPTPIFLCFFFSSRRRHTRWPRDWSSDVCLPILTVGSPDVGEAVDERAVGQHHDLVADRLRPPGVGGEDRVRRLPGRAVVRASCEPRRSAEGGGVRVGLRRGQRVVVG